jgi:hypothetical protein
VDRETTIAQRLAIDLDDALAEDAATRSPAS